MPNAALPDPFWKNIHLLIVDDEEDMREIFAAWFRNLGCQVTEASDGAEALSEFGKDTFDAVISDVRMPKVDGIELARSLNTTATHTPVVIFVSGFNDMTMVDAYDLGIECVLSKPCERKRLIEALRVCLQRKQCGFAEPLRENTAAPEEIKRDFASTAEGAGVAIGRGGMSLPSTKDIDPETTVSFDLHFSSGALQQVTGTGIVRWSEFQAGLFRVGIEFNWIAENCREEVNRHIAARKPSQFIPKDATVAQSA
jgi:CheY-like chemotaxis protein